VVIRLGKISSVVNVVASAVFVAMATPILTDSPSMEWAVGLGLWCALGALLGLHTLLCRVEIRSGRVVIFGRLFRHDFASEDVVAVSVDAYLTFFLRHGGVEVANVITDDVLARQRATRVLVEVREALGVTGATVPVIGTGGPWDHGPSQPVSHRSVNWPPLALLVPWGVWVITLLAVHVVRA
jgi:hypothetical protein